MTGRRLLHGEDTGQVLDFKKVAHSLSSVTSIPCLHLLTNHEVPLPGARFLAWIGHRVGKC